MLEPVKQKHKHGKCHATVEAKADSVCSSRAIRKPKRRSAAMEAQPMCGFGCLSEWKSHELFGDCLVCL